MSLGRQFQRLLVEMLRHQPIKGRVPVARTIGEIRIACTLGASCTQLTGRRAARAAKQVHFWH